MRTDRTPLSAPSLPAASTARTRRSYRPSDKTDDSMLYSPLSSDRARPNSPLTPSATSTTVSPKPVTTPVTMGVLSAVTPSVLEAPVSDSFASAGVAGVSGATVSVNNHER